MINLSKLLLIIIDMGKENKKYALNKKIGNKGSAYVEYLMTDFCLMHRIDEAKDLGADYLCEWVYDETPSGVIFMIQVKTRKESEAIIKCIKPISRLNQLKEVKITNANCKIDKETICYWEGLGIPAFLILVLKDDAGQHKCFYKRFTPILHGERKQEDENYYQLNDGSEFFAFKKIQGNMMGGFARDLFIDHIRCNYKKGSLCYKNPRELGLEQFPEEDTFFSDLRKKYENEIANTLSKLGIEIEKTKSGSSVSSSTSSSGTTTELIEDPLS